MNVLVLTTEPVGPRELEAALGTAEPKETEVMVVAPALHESPLKFWLSDADDAIARAKEVGRETVEQLGEAGVAASADTGEADPLEAVADALQTFAADRIILFTHPEGQKGYREDLDPDAIERRFGVPAVRATVSRG